MNKRRVSALAVVFTSMALAWPALADPPENPTVAGSAHLVSACNVSAAEIEFSSSSVRLTSTAQVALWDIAVWAKANPSRSIRLRGMTDHSGDARSNARVSERRVDAVKTYLHAARGGSRPDHQHRAGGGRAEASRRKSAGGRGRHLPGGAAGAPVVAGACPSSASARWSRSTGLDR